MKKTIFKIEKMDCPSEENLIRMKLDGISGIKSLKFDMPNRLLDVYHDNKEEVITEALSSLNLGSRLISTMQSLDVALNEDHKEQRRLLWKVLIINFSFFLLEGITGFLSNSMGLVADGLDMFADSVVYWLSLAAVGASVLKKKKIAKASGYFQLVLAVFGFGEVIRRFFGYENMPSVQTMIIISLLALTANVVSLWLLQKSKSEEVHMKASMIFTSNDVIVNIGVILAAGLVYFTNSKYPDLIVGAIVFIIVGKGSFRILQLSK